jgi:2-C-methyl-D-erythritol 4-phosphate cytidylyltransferase
VATYGVILVAAGKSSRFHDKHYKKPFAPLDNRAVWLHSAERFLNRDDVQQLILVIAEEDHESFHSKFGANVAILGIDVVKGGDQRTDSVAHALEVVRPDIDFVAIHDAARPCLTNEWIDRVFAKAEETGAAILAIPVAATLKQVAQDGSIEKTVSRDRVWEAQTPQVFQRQMLLDAYAARGTDPVTDDAEVVERSGHKVAVVSGSPINLKITTKEDLRLASQAIKALPKPKILGPSHPFADDDLWR